MNYAGISKLVEDAKRAAGIAADPAAPSRFVPVPRWVERTASLLREQRARMGQARTPHDECTCCRSWRVVEMLSCIDVATIERMRRDDEESAPIPLLPPRARGVDLVHPLKKAD